MPHLFWQFQTCSCGHTRIIYYNYGHFCRKPWISTTDSILEKLTNKSVCADVQFEYLPVFQIIKINYVTFTFAKLVFFSLASCLYCIQYDGLIFVIISWTLFYHVPEDAVKKHNLLQCLNFFCDLVYLKASQIRTICPEIAKSRCSKPSYNSSWRRQLTNYNKLKHPGIWFSILGSCKCLLCQAHGIHFMITFSAIATLSKAHWFLLKYTHVNWSISLLLCWWCACVTVQRMTECECTQAHTT